MKTTIETQASQPTVRTEAENNSLLPAVNVYEMRNAFVIEADMPGVSKDGLEVTMDGHTLTLVGRRNVTPPAGTRVFAESKPAGFRRVFEVDPTIDTGKITARMDQGLLTVTLPKAAAVQPRHITVTD